MTGLAEMSRYRWKSLELLNALTRWWTINLSHTFYDLPPNFVLGVWKP